MPDIALSSLVGRLPLRLPYTVKDVVLKTKKSAALMRADILYEG